MTMVCYNRPNRKNPRVFTAKDVKRISKYALDDGANAFEILAGVGFALGLGYLFCVAARTIDNSASIYRLVLRIAGITALGKFVDFVLTVLTSGAFKRIGALPRFGTVLLVIAAIIEPLLRGMGTLISDAEIILSASETVHHLCDRIKELSRDAGEVIDEKYNDVADFIGDKL